MKVLTISFQSSGHGAYARQRRLADALSAEGHEILWLAPGVDFPGKERWLPLSLGPLQYFGVLGQVFLLLLAFRRHQKILDDVDLIYTFREYDALACKIWPATRNVAHVFFQRGDTVSIEEFHINHPQTLKDKITRPLTVWFYPKLQSWLFPKVDLVVVQAQFLEDLLRERLAGVNFSVHVLPNDCNIQWMHERRHPDNRTIIEQYKKENMTLVGMIAPVYWYAKGFDVFLEALMSLTKHMNCIVLLIGGGPDEQKVERYIHRSTLQKYVFFLGKLSGVYEVLDLFDLIVVPTKVQDACPNLVLEAMAHETPMVASNIDGHVALLYYSELMFKSGDPEALAIKIQTLLSDGKSLHENKELVKKRKEVMNFDWNQRAIECVMSVANKNLDA